MFAPFLFSNSDAGSGRLVGFELAMLHGVLHIEQCGSRPVKSSCFEVAERMGDLFAYKYEVL